MPAQRGRQIASRIDRGEERAQQRRAAGPDASKIVAPNAAPNCSDVIATTTSAIPRVVYGFSRCPVRNSHALQATTAAASAPVTASESATLTSLVPRKP